jgi:hypothetical protein
MLDPIAAPEEATRAPWGMLGSIGLHAAALTLLLVPVTHMIDVPRERSIEVDIISAAQFGRMLASANAPVVPLPVPDIPAAPQTAQPQVDDDDDGLVHASTFHAASILEGPDGRKLREALGNVADSERIVQLCGLEGIEQIHAFDPRYDPDMIVAYTMKDTVRQGQTLIADGAVFRSARAWYRLKFRCTVLPDFSAVTDYAFAIGDAVPREEWEAHDLTEDEGVLDQP